MPKLKGYKNPMPKVRTGPHSGNKSPRGSGVKRSSIKLDTGFKRKTP